MPTGRLLPVLLLLGVGLAWTGTVLGGTPGHGNGDGGEGGISWALSFERALEQARAERKFVMVDFHTSWCGWCKVLDQKTYADPRVAQKASGLVSVKVDADQEMALAARYGVRAFPTIIFLNPDGSARQTVRGYQPPETFLALLDRVVSNQSELYALESRLRISPEDHEARRRLADVLALDSQLAAAAAHLDTLCENGGGSGEAGIEAELDRLILLQRAGLQDGVRKPLERWLPAERPGPKGA